MTKRFRWTSLRGIIRISVISTMIVARASASFAAFLTVNDQRDEIPDWQALRGEFERPADVGDGLSESLVRFVKGASTTSDFEDAVRLSYSMVPLHQVEGLDRLWVDTLITQASSPVITEFLSIRSMIDTTASLDRDYYLEHWVWRTQAADSSDGS
jgi:hypothetical protein